MQDYPLFVPALSSNDADAVRAHSFPASGKSQIFLGGRLDVDLAGLDSAGIGNILAHLRNMIFQFWLLGNYSSINVGNGISLLMQKS